MKLRRRGRLLLLAIGLLVPTAVGAQQPADTTMTGELFVVWGDPPTASEPARVRFFLRDDAGREQLIQIDDAMIRALGGITEVRGKRVSARIERASLRSITMPAKVRGLQKLGINAAAKPAAALSMASRPYVTILCKFADSPNVTPFPREHYEALMGTSYPGVNHYWTEVTEGLTDLNGSIVVGWYTLPRPREAYLPNGDADLSRLAIDCTAAADADIHFPSYSGINLQFNQRLDCCSWGGSRNMFLDGVQRVYPMTWEADWANLGTYAHEVGHSLGLPHSGGPYGRVYDSRWDVMSSSSWVPVSGTPFRVGTHTNGYHKSLLGVIRPDEIVVATGATTAIKLERSAQPRGSGNRRLVQIPISTASGEYYTLEVRSRTGYDSALPVDGIVIHHVAPRTTWNVVSSVIDIDGNGDANDAGATWTLGETFADTRNGITVSVDSSSLGAFSVTVRRSAIGVLALSKRSAARTVNAGTTTSATDSASISVTGNTRWQVAAKPRRIRLFATEGNGSATLRWTTETAGLAPGVYIDTITVTAPAMVGSPARFIDTLRVNAGSELRMGVSNALRVDSLLRERVGLSDTVRVRFSGPGAGTAAWTVSKKLEGTSILTPTSGTGDATIRWMHNAIGRAPGVYVDTLTITASGVAGSPLFVIDTLRVYDSPVVTLQRFGPSRTVIAQGMAAARDSVAVQLNDRWASVGAWNATFVRTARFDRIVAATTPRVGNGVLNFNRVTTTLAPGIYVDSIRVFSTLNGSSSTILVDTLEVTAATAALRLSWNSRSDSVRMGAAQSKDSVLVIVEGPTTGNREWRATARAPRITLYALDAFTAVGSGTGTQWLRYQRNLVGRQYGLQVDTITVTLNGSSLLLLDTLRVLPVRNISALVVVDHILGGAQLSTEDVTIIDGAGNRNGRVDVGDLRAWVQLVGMPVAGAARVQQLLGPPLLITSPPASNGKVQR